MQVGGESLQGSLEAASQRIDDLEPLAQVFDVALSRVELPEARGASRGNAFRDQIT
jgi:hypothetical protein